MSDNRVKRERKRDRALKILANISARRAYARIGK